MKSKILEGLGVDPAIILIAMLILIVILFFLIINVNMKYSRLKFSYNSFMRGKDARSLEESIIERFEELDELTAISLKNRAAIRKINENMLSTLLYQHLYSLHFLCFLIKKSCDFYK